MNLEVKDLLPKLLGFLRLLQKHIKIIVLLLVVGVYSFLIYRVNSLSLAEPSEDDIAAKLTEVKVPKIDTKAVEAIDQLESRNIEIKTLFDEARNNPFQD